MFVFIAKISRRKPVNLWIINETRLLETLVLNVLVFFLFEFSFLSNFFLAKEFHCTWMTMLATIIS